MQRFYARWRNFHGFQDSGWIDFRPLTILVGPNNSGKSSLLLPLILMRQTVRSRTHAPALVSRGELINAGSYRDLVRDHDKESEIVFALRWDLDSEDEEDKLEDVGHYPPGCAEFNFRGPDDIGGHIQLNEYEIRDVYDRLMVRRRLTKNGNYSLGGPVGAIQKAEGPPQSRVDEAIRSMMWTQEPHNFHFRGSSLFSRALRQEREHDPDTELSSYTSSYLSAVDWTEAHIDGLLESIDFLGPLRAPLKRIFELSDEPPESVGTNGHAAPEVLFRKASEPDMGDVNRWLGRLDLPSNLHAEAVSDSAFSLAVGEGTSVADLGFGFSQALPFVVQCLLADEHDFLIATQPEIHLNPRLQARMGSLIPEVISRGAGIAIETHSEHLLLRVRRLIAQQDLAAEDVALYFVEKEDGASFVREVPIDDLGHIDRASWPKEFFADSLRESMALSSAQAERQG